MRRALLLLVAAWLRAQTPTAAMHGVVIDAATGAPMREVRIFVTTAETGMLNGLNATTDDRGRYTLAGLPTGTLTIRTLAAHRLSVIRRIPFAGGDDLTVDLEIPPNARISGRVLDADKQPVAHTLVWMIQPQARDGLVRQVAIGSRSTGPDGGFTFDDLTIGGKFYLLADRPIPHKLDPDAKIDVPTWYGDAAAFEAAAAVELRPGEQRENANIRIRRAAHFCVDGKIEVQGKPAFKQLFIQELALSTSSVERLNLLPEADGTFRGCGLTPGQYRLISYVPTGAIDFTIADKDVHRVNLLIDTARLYLQLAWDGDPVPKNSAAVDLSNLLDQQHFLTVAGAPFDGPFSESLTAGEYAVTVSSPPACCYVKEMTFGGVPVAGNRIRLGAGAGGTLRILLAPGVAQVRFHPDGPYFVWIPESAVSDAAPPSLSEIKMAIAMPASMPPQQLAPGKYRILAIDRPVALPDDLDKLWQAFLKVSPTELAPGAVLDLDRAPISLD